MFHQTHLDVDGRLICTGGPASILIITRPDFVEQSHLARVDWSIAVWNVWTPLEHGTKQEGGFEEASDEWDPAFPGPLPSEKGTPSMNFT